MVIRAPSVKRLVRELNITPSEARIVRKLIKGDIEPESVEATDRWSRQCYNPPTYSALVMHAIDATLETYGVECIRLDEDTFGPPELEYCNTGDSYAATIFRDNNKGTYFIGSWGNEVERLGL